MLGQCQANGQPMSSSRISPAITRYFFSALNECSPSKPRNFLVIAQKMILNGLHGQARLPHRYSNEFLLSAPSSWPACDR